MIPVKMKISGFLSYHQPVEIDFQSFDLACISGANGAGKSSLLDAMTWALFSQARRRDDALINSQSNMAEVVLDFEYESNLYRIQRSKARDKAAQLDFFIHSPDGSWRVLSERTLRDTEAVIRHVLRMDYETFINASFFLQGKADQFAQQNPGARKGILSTILGLEVWEEYRSRAADLRKKEDQELSILDDRLREISLELSQEDQRKKEYQIVDEKLKQVSSLRESKGEILKQVQRRVDSIVNQQRIVETLRKNVAETREQAERQEHILLERMAEKQTYANQIANADEIENSFNRWLDTRKKLEDMDQVAAKFRQVAEERTPFMLEIERERARLEQEKSYLLEQKESVENERVSVNGLDIKVNEIHAEVKSLEENLALRETWEANLIQYQAKKADFAAENKRLRIEMDELKIRINQLSETEGAVCPLCGQDLNEEDRIALIESLNAEGKEKGDLFRKNKEFLDQADDLVLEQRKSLDGLHQKEALLRAKQRDLDQSNSRLEAFAKVEKDWVEVGEIRFAEITQTLEKESFASEARQALLGIDDRLKEMGYDASQHDILRQLEQETRSSQDAMDRLQQARAALKPLEKSIEDLQIQLDGVKEQLQRKEADFHTEETHLEKEMADLPDLKMLDEDYRTTQEEENRLRRELGGVKQKVDVLDQLRKRQVTYRTQRESVSIMITRLKTLERALGKDGVPALLIEQALPEIENQANEILDQLTAGNMTVQFLTQKNYKDKKRDDKKETLDILISDSDGSREYEMFSGGEAFRVNFAIRLALSRVLAQRAGARLQTLVIDEGFGSQDAEGRLRLIEAINHVRPDFAKILVITHLDDLKDAFPTRIEVEKMETGSTVRVWS